MASLMTVPFPKMKINGQYILKEKIGQGSFGQVYKGNILCKPHNIKGYDQETKKDIAIKMVRLFPPLIIF